MSDNAADFFLRLKDQTSGPAANASKSLRKLQDSYRALEKQTKMADRGVFSVFGSKDERRLFAQQHKQQTALIRAQRAWADHQASLRPKKTEPQLGSFGDVFAGSFAGNVAASMLSSVASLAMRATSAVIGLGQSFISASVNAAAFGQDAKLAIGALLRDPAEAAKQFEEVRTEAQRLGTDVFGSVNQFRKLLSAQFDVSTARDIMRMTADLQVAGANVDKAVLAISQIKMKGFLQGEELTGQLAEAGVSAELVYKQLEKQLGKTRKEILTMQRTGQIKADVAIEAIFGAVKAKTGVAEFGELAEKRALQTLSGIYTKAKAATQNLFIDIGEAIGPVLIPIAQRLGGFVENITNNESLKSIGAGMLESLQGAAAWVDANWEAIEETLSSGLKLAAEGAQSLVTAAKDLVTNWDIVKASFRDLFGPLYIAWVAMAKFAASTENAMQKALALFRVLMNLKSLIPGFGGPIGGPSQVLTDFGVSAGQVASGQRDAGLFGSMRDAMRVWQGKGTFKDAHLQAGLGESAFEIPASFPGAMPGGMNMMRLQGMGGGQVVNNNGDVAINMQIDASQVSGTPEEMAQTLSPMVRKEINRVWRHQFGNGRT